MTVYPIRFDGNASHLVAYPELEVTLSCDGGRGGLGEPTGPLSRIVELVLPNYEGGGTRGSASADTGHVEVCSDPQDCAEAHTDYLMHVDTALMDSIGILAEHRAAWNGYNVGVVSTSSVVSYAGAAAISDSIIRDFIQEVYQSGSAEHMADGKLGYVLLVGDARSDNPNTLVPAHEAGVITSDHWYACVEGDDEYADIMLGRLATSHVSELVTEAHKIRYYEVNASSEDSWRDNALLACGFAWGWDHESCYEGDDSKAATTDSAFQAAAICGYRVDETHAHEMPGTTCRLQRDAAA
ncbi:MAG: hypothetical protein JXB46_04315, partial [Candidatus Eisenbacteria bacterium]|nr:hypothetical protein [Candidatus Eisenbacteria bacterium]